LSQYGFATVQIFPRTQCFAKELGKTNACFQIEISPRSFCTGGSSSVVLAFAPVLRPCSMSLAWDVEPRSFRLRACGQLRHFSPFLRYTERPTSLRLLFSPQFYVTLLPPFFMVSSCSLFQQHFAFFFTSPCVVRHRHSLFSDSLLIEGDLRPLSSLFLAPVPFLLRDLPSDFSTSSLSSRVGLACPPSKTVTFPPPSPLSDGRQRDGYQTIEREAPEIRCPPGLGTSA